MKNYFIKSLFLSLLICSTVFSFNIKLLKNTHTVLPDELYQYAPVWGLAFKEQKVIESLYVLSKKGLLQYIDSEIPGSSECKIKIVEQIKADPYTAMQTLTNLLFYRQGLLFGPIAAPGSFASKLKPKHIGYLLHAASSWKTLPDLSKKNSKGLVIDPEFTKLMNYFKQEFQGDAKEIAQYSQFIRAFIEALAECNPKDGIYPKNTVQGVLLGFMLYKVDSKQDLQNYFQAFDAKIVLDVRDLYTDEELLDSAKNIEIELEKEFELKPSFINMNKFGNYVCGCIFQKSYLSDFPPFMSYRRDMLYKKATFTDCAEVGIRNLCNVITFDTTTKQFNTTQNHIKLSQALHDFYNFENHKDPLQANQLTMHEKWLNLVENISGVTYLQLCHNDGTLIAKADHTISGFILVDFNDSSLPEYPITSALSPSITACIKTINNKNYVLVPQESGLMCCEVSPTLSNVIVLLNILFKCKFSMTITDTLKPDFIDQFLLKTCQSLGLIIEKESHDINKPMLWDLILRNNGNSFKIINSNQTHMTFETVNKNTQINEVDRFGGSFGTLWCIDFEKYSDFYATVLSLKNNILAALNEDEMRNECFSKHLIQVYAFLNISDLTTRRTVADLFAYPKHYSHDKEITIDLRLCLQLLISVAASNLPLPLNNFNHFNARGDFDKSKALRLVKKIDQSYENILDGIYVPIHRAYEIAHCKQNSNENLFLKNTLQLLFDIKKNSLTDAQVKEKLKELSELKTRDLFTEIKQFDRYLKVDKYFEYFDTAIEYYLNKAREELKV